MMTNIPYSKVIFPLFLKKTRISFAFYKGNMDLFLEIEVVYYLLLITYVLLEMSLNLDKCDFFDSWMIN